MSLHREKLLEELSRTLNDIASVALEVERVRQQQENLRLQKRHHHQQLCDLLESKDCLERELFGEESFGSERPPQ